MVSESEHMSKAIECNPWDNFSLMMNFSPLKIGSRHKDGTWHGGHSCYKCGQGKTVKSDRDPRSVRRRTKRIIFTSSDRVRQQHNEGREGELRRGTSEGGVNDL